MHRNRKLVYFFGGADTEGGVEMVPILGGKGAGLAEMARLGIPVPPGFTISTTVCREFRPDDTSAEAEVLETQVREQMARVEASVGSTFGGTEQPLLVSVRSGAPVSMPGMMDSVLNLGLSEEIVHAQLQSELGWFYCDCYRRFLTMYSDVVLEVPMAKLLLPLQAGLAEVGGTTEHDLSAEQLLAVCTETTAVVREHGKCVPSDPWEQLWGAVWAVFRSWQNPRAVEYRRIEGISDDTGTAVNVQSMVYGNRGQDCASGVAFSRSPATGEKLVYGEYLHNVQGEDVVAGTHTPKAISGRGAGLREDFPQAHAELGRVCDLLESHFRDMQDVEFTIQHGKLYMLQTRAGKRSGPAAVKIAVDMALEGLISKDEAVSRVTSGHVVQMMAPVFEERERNQAIAAGRLLAHGLAAGPGAASGRIAFSAERAAVMAADGQVVLVRDETSPEDIVGMHAASGILTTRGGMTSHAAVVARGLGKPCVVGATELEVHERAGVLRAGPHVLREGEQISLDGSRGEILVGAMAAHPSEFLRLLFEGGEAAAESPEQALLMLLGWADSRRRMRVRANADTPADAARAVALGAEGIGLCRTEHMFFEEDRIFWVRRMILAEHEEERREALAQLLPMQRADFEGILRALGGRPVTIRLLDPPLHEFLPTSDAAIGHLASQVGKPMDEVRAAVEALRESNPMLGHRGCRLGVTTPEIYEMQVEAIARAACSVAQSGEEVAIEIMIPLVGVRGELKILRRLVEDVWGRVAHEEGRTLPVAIGTMIEVPRAALVADRLAKHADFFSFGTNDLTQMCFGFSRDDAGRFLPGYIERGILRRDPFATLDEDGVGELVRYAARRGREQRSRLKLGVCGEHGGDAASISFFESCGLDYVSCSPYRIPIARLAAARASLEMRTGPSASSDSDSDSD